MVPKPTSNQEPWNSRPRGRRAALAIAAVAAVCVSLVAATVYGHVSAQPAYAEAAVAPYITIDPGHGGKDTGAAANGVVEKNVNLAIALAVNKILQAAGYRTVMTRTGDTYPSLAARVATANDRLVDVYFSIHNNASISTKARGTETFYHGGSVPGKAFASEVHKATLAAVHNPDRGVKSDTGLYQSGRGIYLLRNTKMAGSLIEVGFVTNRIDAHNLASAGYRKKAATGIANGIINHLKKRRYGTSYTSLSVPANMVAGVDYKAPITVANTGHMTWTAGGANPVVVSYSWRNRDSGATIQGPGTPLPRDVHYGETVAVNANVKAPPYGGRYELAVQMKHQGVTYFSPKGVATVNRNVSVTYDYKAQFRSDTTPASMFAWTTYAAPVTVKNTGRSTWPKRGTVGLGYRWYQGTKLLSSQGIRTYPTVDVGPGRSYTFAAKVRPPGVSGALTLRWDMVHTGVTWFSSKGVAVANRRVTVGYNYKASFTKVVVPAKQYANRKATATVDVVNASRMTWPAGGPIGLNYVWVNSKRQAVLKGAAPVYPRSWVNPQKKYTFKIQVKAPATVGVYTLKFDMLHKTGKTTMKWFETAGSRPYRTTVTVSPSARATISGYSPSGAATSYRVMVDGKAVKSLPGSKLEVVYYNGAYTLTAPKYKFYTKSYPRFVPGKGTIMKVNSMRYANLFRSNLAVRYSPAHSSGGRSIPGQLWVINEVSMQNYLKGLLEEPQTFPPSAFKALVIAMRSYAYSVKAEHKHNADEPFDLCSSTDQQYYGGDCQQYYGYTTETLGPTHPNRQSKLVDDTNGVVMTYGGKVIRAAYFGHCDGWTRNGPRPYLKAKRDKMCDGLKLTAHGLGMCMHAAAYRASKMGWTAARILTYYYTGVKIEKKIGNPVLRVGVYSVQ